MSSVVARPKLSLAPRSESILNSLLGLKPCLRCIGLVLPMVVVASCCRDMVEVACWNAAPLAFIFDGPALYRLLLADSLVNEEAGVEPGKIVTPIFWSKKSDLINIVSFCCFVFAGKGRG